MPKVCPAVASAIASASSAMLPRLLNEIATASPLAAASTTTPRVSGEMSLMMTGAISTPTRFMTLISGFSAGLYGRRSGIHERPRRGFDNRETLTAQMVQEKGPDQPAIVDIEPLSSGDE